MGSLPAVAISPSAGSPALGTTVILVELRAEEHALVANALGADVELVEVRVEQLSNLRRASSSVVVCRGRATDVERVAGALGADADAPPIVALCENGAAATAALGAGAYDAVVAPHIENLLVASVRRAVAHQELVSECRRLERTTEREPQRNQQPNLARSVANGRWLQNVLPLDPLSKSSEPHALSITESDSEIDGEEEFAEALSPEQHLSRGHRLGQAKADFEKRYLEAALIKCRGNLAAAARCSGMDRSNFRRLLKRYGLHPSSVSV